jgi:hypothetical protein
MGNTTGWRRVTTFKFRVNSSWAAGFVAFLTAIGVGAGAQGHDYWLLADHWQSAPGASVTLSLWVGDDFVPEEERAWSRGRAARFARVSSRGVEDLRERPAEGAQPVLTARFRGAPLAGVTVEALSRVGDDVRRARAVTDARGDVRFTLDREGTWLIRATHMVRCEGCADADWESFWSSYSFGLCAPGSATCAAAPMTVRPSNPPAR